MLINDGGIYGALVVIGGFVIWKLFNRLEKQNDRIQEKLVNLVTQGQSELKQVAVQLTDISARLGNVEREIERIRT